MIILPDTILRSLFKLSHLIHTTVLYGSTIVIQLHRWRNYDGVKLSNMPKFTQLVNDEAKT